ncbi:MAG: hypothetical protein MUC41_11110 [Syntrophobacteraceae bacterium]|jgi:hypothetical protein|nr:hypothetical protein [Syntrophobacteraceae bacterium]
MRRPFDLDGKAFVDADLVCFCFGYTKKRIEVDCRQNGFSTLLDKIVREKRTGGCDCARKNPSGR